MYICMYESYVWMTMLGTKVHLSQRVIHQITINGNDQKEVPRKKYWVCSKLDHLGLGFIGELEFTHHSLLFRACQLSLSVCMCIPNSHIQKKKPKSCVVSACESWLNNILFVIIKMQKHNIIVIFLNGLITE